MIALAVPTLVATLLIPAPFGRYSDASWGPLLPALPCWIIMEIPNLIAAAYFAAQVQVSSLGVVKLTLLFMFVAHYINRTIIYPLRQTNRKPMPLLVPLSAFAFTSFNGYLQCKSIVESPPYSPDHHHSLQFIAGAVLFAAGMCAPPPSPSCTDQVYHFAAAQSRSSRAHKVSHFLHVHERAGRRHLVPPARARRHLLQNTEGRAVRAGVGCVCVCLHARVCVFALASLTSPFNPPPPPHAPTPPVK